MLTRTRLAFARPHRCRLVAVQAIVAALLIWGIVDAIHDIWRGLWYPRQHSVWVEATTNA